MNRLALLISTFGCVGFFPFAPGTAGSLAALALYGLIRIGGPAVEAAAIAAVFAAGVWASARAEALLGASDPGPVVIDEVMGMLITLFLNPVGWIGALVAFLLFRLFDVIKPYPANRLELLPGGVGVMADDGMAAIYANLTLRVMLNIG